MPKPPSKYMDNKNNKQVYNIGPVSYIWHKIFVDNNIPAGGAVIEVAPGHEPKICHALSLLRFKGCLFLIEPDAVAAAHALSAYRRILPDACVWAIVKPLQDVRVGMDVPVGVDALVASHPFDDMVIAAILKRPSFFSEEMKERVIISASSHALYDTMRDGDYTVGTIKTVAVWKKCVSRLKPNLFIASQYPSRTLYLKKLLKRQSSCFAVLAQLKKFYKDFLVERDYPTFGFKGESRWWIVVDKRSSKLVPTGFSTLA